MARRGDHIFNRPGTKNLYAKFQYPKGWWHVTGREKVIALGTPDRAEAKASRAYLEALEEFVKFRHLVTALKRMREIRPDLTLEELRTLLESKGGHRTQEPGTLVHQPDGSRTFADAETIHMIGPDGKADPAASKENEFVVNISEYAYTPKERREIREADGTLKKAQRKDVDSEIVEAYITHAKLRKDDADATRRTLSDWKDVMDGKTFSQADRDDAQALVDHLREERDLRASHKTPAAPSSPEGEFPVIGSFVRSSKSRQGQEAGDT